MALSWKKDYLRYKELFLKLLVIYKKRNDLRMFLEILLSLITITFFSLFALKPTLLTVSQLIKDNKEKQETIDKMQQKIINIETAKNTYNRYVNLIPLIEHSVPNTPTPETFLRQIEGIAYINSVNIVSSSVNETPLFGIKEVKNQKTQISNLPSNVSTISFSVSVTGSYSSLYNFLLNLEKTRRPIIIDSVNLNSSKASNDETALVMLISGQTIYINK